MDKYNAWMRDEFGNSFAVIMLGPYNVVEMMATRLASSIGASFGWLELIP